MRRGDQVSRHRGCVANCATKERTASERDAQLVADSFGTEYALEHSGALGCVVNDFAEHARGRVGFKPRSLLVAEPCAAIAKRALILDARAVEKAPARKRNGCHCIVSLFFPVVCYTLAICAIR